MENKNLSPNNIDDFYSYYTSAPTSPRRYNMNGFLFLSMPTSPTRGETDSNFGSRKFDTTDDFLNLVDNFEFEGSKRFYDCDNRFGKSQSQSQELCYADELFFDGKMLPLRPPPKTRYTRSGKSSTASSPGTRTSTIKVPFLRQKSLWNDGYDPFTSALTKVTTESNDVAQLRRAKSLSPLRSIPKRRDGSGPNPNKDGFRPVERIESAECRKQKMKKYLLKNASFGKSEKKEQSINLMLRKLNYSVRFNSVTPKTIVKISRDIKSLMKHRAKFFLCLAKGFGSKCSRKLS
ncbi:hypothetical protein RND81_04G238700 [Saponaria officinalis]|uniref:Uncharacterized protein n=1 Tax=Saponaria officinalis TaxID=3572 RepID=A0AAW1LQ37_SAPOF